MKVKRAIDATILENLRSSAMEQKIQLSAVISHLKIQFNEYRYTVYRSAAKMVALQKVFYISQIPYRLVLSVLNRCEMRVDDMIPPFQLMSFLSDICVACDCVSSFSPLSPNLRQQNYMLANFFWDVFDAHRRYSISLIEIKITLLLLCKLYASDQLVKEFYNILHDKSGNVSKLNFEYLVNTLSKLCIYVGENEAYGLQNVSTVMEQCFSTNKNDLSQQEFHCLWNRTESRFLIYANLVALIKRLEDTEYLVHNNKCASCDKPKIIGMRFKCQTCKNLSLCLNCFATGYVTNRHHNCGHRMYEVFSEDLPQKKISHFFAKLCDMFLPSQQNDDAKESHSSKELTISNHNVIPNITPVFSIFDSKAIQQNSQNVSTEISSKLEPSLLGLTTSANNAINVSERLQALIESLFRQNDKLETQLKIVKTATHEEMCDFLKSHKQFLTQVINEMRNFKPIIIYPASSTPCRNEIPMTRSSIASYSTVPRIVRDSNLTRSIYGAEINRSYVEANRSDYSLKDVSFWFSKNSRVLAVPLKPLLTVKDISSSIQTEVQSIEMTNFRQLLHKVKEILEDSYSDNIELAEATQNLENVLDSIIQLEESRRRSV